MSVGLPSGVTDDHQEWVVDFSNFREAWALTPPPGGKQKGEGVVVAHPDTGYTSHPELPSDDNYFGAPPVSVNFFKPDFIAEDPLPPSLLVALHPSHGTSTASVLVSHEGRADSGSGSAGDKLPPGDPGAYVTGVAPKATVIPYRVTESVVLTPKSDKALVACIYHSIKLQQEGGADTAVMSVSLGRRLRSRIEKKIETALEAARENGIVVVAAAAQAYHSDDGVAFPGSSKNTICAASCDSGGKRMEKAFYGPEVDITAPGVNVWIARSLWRKFQTPTFTVTRSEGTSYATAITAGACALWQGYHGRETLIAKFGRDKIFFAFKHCLSASSDSAHPEWAADPVGRGSGILDALALLQHPLPSRDQVDAMAAAA